MKKQIVLNLLYLFITVNTYAQNEARYLHDLARRPEELTEIQAKYLIDHPGATTVLNDTWNYPKMYTNKYCFTPFDPSICTASYLKKVSYSNGWREKKFTTINTNEMAETALLFRFGFIISLLAIVGPKLFYLIGFLSNIFKKGYVYSDYEKYLRLGGTKNDEEIKKKYLAILFFGNAFLLFASHMDAPKTKEGAVSILIWVFLPILAGIILAKLFKLIFVIKDKLKQFCFT